MTSAEAPHEDVWGKAADAFAAWYDGRPEAMTDLVRVMTPVLWQVARASRLSPEDAADVVQLAWLALVRAAHTITDPRAVPAWLITTVRRDAVRRSRAASRTAPVDDELLDVLAPVAPPAEEVAADRDERRRLWRAVRTLTERCQELLRVVAFERRPDYAAIAARLDMRIGSIGPTRARCLDKLRVALTGGAA